MDEDAKATLQRVCEALGRIEARQDALCKSQDKMFYGLLGVIAALIGVKMLGTDPFLYVATALAAVGVFLGLGLINTAMRVGGDSRLSKAGWALVIFLACAILVQVGVFLRDLNMAGVTPRVIYIGRSAMNGALIYFIWRLWQEPKLFKNKRK